MNQQFIYPQNLKAQAKLWLWRIKDIAVIGGSGVISVLALTQIGFLLPIVLTLLYAFLTVSFDDISVMEFIKRALRYFITTQQYYVWQPNTQGDDRQ